MEYLFIYLLQAVDVIDTINVLSIVGFTVLMCSAVFLGFLTTFQFDTLNEEEDTYTGELKTTTAKASTKFVKKWLTTCVIIALATGFLPTKQTLLLTAGVYYGKQVIQSEKMQKINEIIDIQLDKVLKDLKQEVQGGKS